MPLRLEAAILSRTRSPITSRSNWAKESSTLSVSRPMLEVVLNDWVIDTNDTPYRSNNSTSLAKSASERRYSECRQALRVQLIGQEDDHVRRRQFSHTRKWYRRDRTVWLGSEDSNSKMSFGNWARCCGGGHRETVGRNVGALHAPINH